MDKNDFDKMCLAELQALRDEYSVARDNQCKNLAHLSHFGSHCFYLGKVTDLYQSSIPGHLQSLIQEIFGTGKYKRGLVSVYSLHQEVFADWVEINFPFLLVEDNWSPVLSAVELDFSEFRKIVFSSECSYVKHYKKLHSRCVTHLPLLREPQFLRDWTSILRRNGQLQEDTDYWKLGIPLYSSGILSNKLCGAIKKVMKLEPSQDLRDIYEANKDKWEKLSVKDDVDKILRYLQVRPEGLSPEQKKRILVAHIVLLPIPPVVCVNGDFLERPLFSLYLELVDKKDLSGKVKAKLISLGEHFLKKAILYWNEVTERLSNQKDVKKVFGEHFLVQSAKWSGYHTDCESKIGPEAQKTNGSPSSPDLLPVLYFNIKHGFMNAEQISLKAIVDFWANLYPDVLTEGSIFLKFGEAERILFWLDEYREHLIHSLKVYLLGRTIIDAKMEWWLNSDIFQQIFARNKINTEDAQKEVARFAWTSAAFFHDFTIGLEKIAEVMSKFIESFTSKEPDNIPKLENVQDGLIEWFVREDIFHAFFILLYNIMRNALPDIKHFEPRDAFHGLEPEGQFPLRDLFIHFLGKGDHGISAAISYLAQVYPELQVKASDKQNWKKDSLLHFKIAEAILMHNLLFKTVVEPNQLKQDDVNKVKSVFFLPQEYEFYLDKNPIGLLLAVCDKLQDWGRKEGSLPNKLHDGDRQIDIEISKRPYGRIDQIQHYKDKVEITIDYKWIARTKQSGETHRDFDFCPWQADLYGYRNHKDAPKECKEAADKENAKLSEFKCADQNDRQFCSIFAKSYDYLAEIVRPRLHLKCNRIIDIRIKYEGEEVPNRSHITLT